MSETNQTTRLQTNNKHRVEIFCRVKQYGGISKYFVVKEIFNQKSMAESFQTSEKTKK